MPIGPTSPVYTPTPGAPKFLSIWDEVPHYIRLVGDPVMVGQFWKTEPAGHPQRYECPYGDSHVAKLVEKHFQARVQPQMVIAVIERSGTSAARKLALKTNVKLAFFNAKIFEHFIEYFNQVGPPGGEDGCDWRVHAFKKNPSIPSLGRDYTCEKLEPTPFTTMEEIDLINRKNKNIFSGPKMHDVSKLYHEDVLHEQFGKIMASVGEVYVRYYGERIYLNPHEYAKFWAGFDQDDS